MVRESCRKGRALWDAHRDMLRVRLFGFVSYVVDDGDEIRLSDLRFPRVLAYLAVHASTHPTKAAVRSAVWGRVGAEDNLRRTVRELRDQHPRLAAYIHEQGRTIGFEPSATLKVDALTFAELKRDQRYDEALREVRGGFMASVPNDLSEWVDSERRRWNGQVGRVCELLAARAWYQGKRDSAIELAHQSQRLRPDDLAAAVGLAGYLAASGEIGEGLAALNAFQGEHRSLAQHELRRLKEVIANLRAGGQLALPQRPVPANGAAPADTPPAANGAPEVRQPLLPASHPRHASSEGQRPRVCSRADEALRDEYRLAGWVQRLVERREFYFGWCDHATRRLMELTDGAEPKAESLVWTLVAALGEDESFASHARSHGGLFLTEDANWEKLYHAAAATILEEYMVEAQKGTWP